MSFSLGINYFPARKAMYWWKRFDLEEVEADFNLISLAGFDSVRVFLIWEDFQPSPNKISEQALKNLVSVADVALRNQLRLIVTFFTGHMSGVNWLPEWAIVEDESYTGRFRLYSNGRIRRGRIKNWYEDEQIIEAQRLLVSEVASALKGHSAIWAWDLGNENSNCVMPSSRSDALRWLETITDAIRQVEKKLITLGLHAEDLEEDRRLSPAEASMFCDFLCMHGYPIYTACSKSPVDAALIPFLGLLTKWLGNGKEVLFEEFGLPTVPSNVVSPVPSLSEDEVAFFVAETLELLYKFNFLGAMIWCYADYSTDLWAKPPLDEAVHERYFGLWVASDNVSMGESGKDAGFSENASDNVNEGRDFGGFGEAVKNQVSLREKRAVSSVREFSAKIKNPEIVEKASRLDEDFSWIDIEPKDYYLNPKANMFRLYENFRKKYGLE